MIQVAGADGQYRPVDLGDLLPYGEEAPVSYVDFRGSPRPTIAEAWAILDRDTIPRIREITVDLDVPGASSKALTVLARMPPHVASIRTSNDGHGQHLRVVLWEPCTAWQALHLREDLGDDPNRLAYDLYRAASGHPEDAGGWLADEKAYWDVAAKEERWGQAGEWAECHRKRPP